MLSARHSFSNSELLRLSSRVIVLNVEHNMHPLSAALRLYRRKRRDMITLKQLRKFWILGVATMVLACFSNAVAQASYKVQDLGVQHPNNLGMTMGLNNSGWSLIMDQRLDSFSVSLSAHLVSGTVRISLGELNLELGTLGGTNSSINWNGINDREEAVGMSETSVPDPNGEDICGFGTHLTCLPFRWRNGVMSALPTGGGNK